MEKNAKMNIHSHDFKNQPKTKEKFQTKIYSQNRLNNRHMVIISQFFSKEKARNKNQKENQIKRN